MLPSLAEIAHPTANWLLGGWTSGCRVWFVVWLVCLIWLTNWLAHHVGTNPVHVVGHIGEHIDCAGGTTLQAKGDHSSLETGCAH